MEAVTEADADTELSWASLVQENVTFNWYNDHQFNIGS